MNKKTVMIDNTHKFENYISLSKGSLNCITLFEEKMKWSIHEIRFNVYDDKSWIYIY